MSVGRKDSWRCPFRWLPGSPNNKKTGLTLVELLVVALIFGVIMSALFITLNVGEFSITVNSNKVDAQAHTRMLMDLVVKDIRQAITSELVANSPTTNYLKFNLWSWNVANATWQLGSQYREYEYTPAENKMSRRLVDGNGIVLEEVDYLNVLRSPFYTSYTSETSNQFDSNELLQNRKLIVVIEEERPVRNSQPVNFTLIEEVKIRNG
jgi:prepilin-type N-terminal cleavage/methylation domain-containing protein